MKKITIILCSVASVVLFAACGSHKDSYTSNRDQDWNSLTIGKTAAASNNYKIIVGEKRVTYDYGGYGSHEKDYQRKQLKKLSLEKAKEKVLQEACIAHDCAMIVEPSYQYETKGRRITKIRVVGYKGNYNFNKDSNE